jgi:hypothetical protein
MEWKAHIRFQTRLLLGTKSNDSQPQSVERRLHQKAKFLALFCFSFIERNFVTHGKQKRKQRRKKKKKIDCRSHTGTFRKTRTSNERKLWPRTRQHPVVEGCLACTPKRSTSTTQTTPAFMPAQNAATVCLSPQKSLMRDVAFLRFGYTLRRV